MKFGKRVLALLLCLSIMAGFEVTAVAVNTGTINLSKPTLYTTDNAQTIDATISFETAVDAKSVGGSVVIPSGWSVSSVTVNNGTYVCNVGPLGFTWLNPSGVNTDIHNVVVTYSVPAGLTEGNIVVGVNALILGTATGDYPVDEENYSATIKVEAAQPVTDSAYELWYELNSIKDDLTANYKDYEAGADVVATIKLKSTANTSTMQAYDIYLTYSDKLEYQSDTLAGTAYKTGNTVASTGDKVTHIQLVKDSGKYVTLNQNAEVTLGKITFKIADTAAYDEDLAITLVPHTESDMGVNIARDDTTQSFYPTVTSTVFGAEVVTTYEVSFSANTTDAVTGMPSAVTKEHNKSLTLPSAVPVRTGYTFKGWDTNASATTGTYAAGGTLPANVNAITTLYAIWEAKDVDYTVKHYKQDINGTYPSTPDETETKQAKANTSVTPEVKSYTGFTAPAAQTVTVKADGSTVVEYQYTRNSYTVTFNANGHGTAPANQTVKYGDKATKPTDLNVTGYAFGGWYKEAACTTAWDFNTDTITGNTTLYAKWTANTTVVTLDPNYTGAATTSTNQTFGSKYTGLTALTRDGYTFDGWFTAAEGGTQVTADTTVTNTDAHILYAHWTAISYTVRFNANGGSGTMSDQSFTYDAAQDLTANGFTYTGYTFKGWSTSTDPALNADITYSNGQSVSNLTTTANGIVNLYAVWTQDNYTIGYTLGENAVNGEGNPTTYRVADLPITLADPTREGYTFIGWTEPTLLSTATKNYCIPVGTTGDLTFTANWQVNQYTITFQTSGGSTIASITQDYGTEVTAPANPTRKGHTFTGWDTTIPATMPAENMTITAQWNINQYTITFNTDGGSAIDPITQNYGTTITAPANPTKTGYTFNGWDQDIPSTMPGENVTIKAKWTANTYTVKFDKNDTAATGTTADQTFTYDQEEELTANGYEKTGYDFLGWSADSSATTATYNNQAPVRNLTDEADGVVTLYAVWKASTYTVSFNTGEHPQSGTAQPAPISVTYDEHYGTLPTITPAPGYTFDGWYNGGNKVEGADAVDITGNVTLTAHYTPIAYTITFNTDGGTEIAAKTYTIESEDKLPEATGRTNYKFVEWKVVNDGDAGGNWEKGSTYRVDGDGTQVSGKYGDVTLTAQWTESLRYKAEEYKYALNTQRLLIVDASGAAAGEVYKYDDQVMYYTTDPGYQITTTVGSEEKTSEAVYYTLIDAGSNTLDAEQIAKIQTVAGERMELDYNGDINGDGKINIADANTVFQMLNQEVRGNYYSLAMLGIEGRLKADMVKTVSGADHRGSIEDVNAIVNIINRVSG